MKRRAGQAGRIIGEAVHQLGRIVMMVLLLVLLAVCLLGFRLSYGPIHIPDLASCLATAASGEGISVQMQEADLGWAGYHQGGGVPFYLQLGNIDVRNEVGVELVHIPSARLQVLPAALFGARRRSWSAGPMRGFRVRPCRSRCWRRSGLGRFQPRPRGSVRYAGCGRLGSGVNSVPITGGGFTLAVTPSASSLPTGIWRWRRWATACRNSASPVPRNAGRPGKAASPSRRMRCRRRIFPPTGRRVRFPDAQMGDHQHYRRYGHKCGVHLRP